MHRFVLVALVALTQSVAFMPVTPARAQSSPDIGIITITVIDSSTKKPLPQARILLFGATQASALTNASGIVKYTDVPSGLYRVRAGKPGFGGSTSPQFEMLGNKQVDVDVSLAAQTRRGAAAVAAPTTDPSGMKVIGRVSTKVSITTRDVDSDSSIRKVSDSLTDALSKIAGVDVTQTSNDPDAAQTISLNGHDETQTAVTLDGIPLGASGSAVDLRSLNTDLFGGATVSSTAQAGALGGAVNFRTLQPTQTWISRASTSDGTFDRFNYQIAETGSFGKLGIALLHTLRESNSPLTFATYTDQSGFAYSHAGESSTVGNYLKLRYALDDRTTLNFTALQNNRGNSSLCTQDVTIVPCGIGPGNTAANTYQFVYGTLQKLIGEVTTSLSTYINSSAASQNDALRYIDGVSAPLVTSTRTLARGVAFLSTLDQGRSTWTFNGSTYSSRTSFQPLIDAGAFVVPSTVGTSSQSYALSDLYKVNDRLSVGPNVSLASSTGTGTSVLGGLSGTWRPTGSDTYGASVNIGSSQPAAALVRTFSDPAGARFNCVAGTASVSGPGDLAGRQSAISYDANWTHAWKYGSLNLDLYRQTQANQLVTAQIVGTDLGLNVQNPYFQALQGYFTSPFTCGADAVLKPADVYVSEPVGATRRVYAGFTISGRIALGPHLVAIPSFQTNAAVVTATDARLAGLNSTTIIGAQLPGRPVHRGNLTLDGDIPRAALELLTNVQYVGSNNAQHLDPYAEVSVGASHALGMGRLAFLETNVFNTESGVLSSLAFAQPIPVSGGGVLFSAANPNPPRQFSLTYSFNTGAQRGAGGARPARNAGASASIGPPQPLAAGSPVTPERTRGVGAFTPYLPPAGVDPLALADTRASCTPEDAQTARPVLEQLRAAAAAYTAGKTLIAVDGLSLVPHSAGNGWYFDIRPDVPRLPAGGGSQPPSMRRGSGPAGAESSGQSGADPPSGALAAGGVEHVAGSMDIARPHAAPNPASRAVIRKFSATLRCAYFTVLTQQAAESAGYSTFHGRNGLGYAPAIGLFAVRPADLGTGGGSLKH